MESFGIFVVTRIEAPTLLEEVPQANERPDNDIQWTRIVELDFVPHPRVERPEIIEMDYGMTGGSDWDVRSCSGGRLYVLQRWRVDCSTQSLPKWTGVPFMAQRSSSRSRREKRLTGTRSYSTSTKADS